MPVSRYARAFTLIEAMIVVAIIGILSLLAVVAYQKWIRTTYMAEAHDIIANIRAAEEAARAENGTYLTISKGFDPPNMYPAPTPGAFKTQWGGPCNTCIRPWSALSIEAKGTEAFGYAVISDDTAIPTVTISGTAVDLTAMTSAPPWYAVEAVGDINGNGVFTKVYAFSATNQLMVDNEGE